MKALRKNTIRFLSALLCFFTIFAIFIFPTKAEKKEPDLSAASSVILYSITGDKILLSSAPDKAIYPSATVKIMSGLLLCESFSERLEEKVVLGADMLRHTEGRKFGLSVGDELLIGDLMKIALCGSFNDAYAALAVISEGDIEAFIEKMNSRAAELGAFSTKFTNVSGLDNEEMRTTARDILKIAVAAEQNELYMRLSSTFSYTVTVNGTKTVENRNELHNIYGDFYNPNAYGLCTGSTELGGNCLVTKGEIEGAEYICIVMGVSEESRDDRENLEYSLASSLLTYAAENYSVITLREKGEVVGSLPVTLSDSSSSIDLILGEDIKILRDLNAPADDDRTFDLMLSKKTLKAPVEAGTVVGYMVVRSGNEILASVPVVTAKAAPKNDFLAMLDGMKGYITGRAFIAFLIFAVSGAILFFIGVAVVTEASRKKRRRNYRVTRLR